MPPVATTQLIEVAPGRRSLSVPRYRVEVIDGPDAGKSAQSVDGRLSVGTVLGVTLPLDDPTASRYHLELEATPEGIVVRDLDSTNGTLLDGHRVRELVVQTSVVLEVGHSRLRLVVGDDRASVAASPAAAFGGLIGASAVMRAVYETLERAAPTTAPVLLSGESGTGKEVAARAVHAASRRASEPFEVVDCGGLPPTLVESELFGHERGAFTGAVSAYEGAFERADGGTLFLDELGELPLEVQPKLLRVLGEGQIRRVGGKATRKVDVRIVAATNRDLRREVNAGRFRADLFYRLAVIHVRMPPLRERLDDLPALVPSLLERIARDRGVEIELPADAALLDALGAHRWPGNVRELRNHLEQWVILKVPPALGAEEGPHSTRGDLMAGLDRLPFSSAKERLVERFEREYVARLLEQTDGNVAEAARRAGINRATLFRIIRRHGLRGAAGPEGG